MRLVSLWAFIFFPLKMFNLQEVEEKTNNRDMIKLMQGFNRVKQYYNELVNLKDQENQRMKEHFMKNNEEEKRRKIINQHLMPLTRGNSFMRDFYAGRF